ncbi:MAG: hypothetical protein ACK55Z_20330, partial [bacterium]
MIPYRRALYWLRVLYLPPISKRGLGTPPPPPPRRFQGLGCKGCEWVGCGGGGWYYKIQWVKSGVDTVSGGWYI